MWNKLIALAVTIPATITIASAQAAQDADIAAYSQDLATRIARGQQSGQLSLANYNSLQALYNNVESIRRGIGNKPMNPMIRMNMMNSLTNLDKQLTGHLHDNVNARYQMWDPSRKTWRNNWWQADNSGANNFNGEIDAYQNSLKQRIDSGRASGRITRRELSQLAQAYDNIDRTQQQYRIGGFSRYERNSLMSMLTQLDRDITTQMHDDENSHYRNWNSNGNSWNNSWWKNNTSATPLPPGQRPGDGRPGWDRGESGEHGRWNRNDSNRHDWGRGESNHRGDWNRGGSNRGGKYRDDNNNDSNRRDWNRGDSGHSGWNRNDGGRSDWNRGDSNRPDWNRSGSPTSNAPAGNTTPGAGAPPQGSTPSATNPPSTVPPSTSNPPVTNIPPGAGTPPSTNNPPSATNPPSTGSGRTGDGSGRTWGGSGSGGSRFGDGNRPGDGSGRTWDVNSSGTRRPPN